jgi:hypothetical protein
MLIGFFLRRFVTVALCAGSFWLGIKADHMVSPGSVAAPVAAVDCPEAGNGN